MAFPVVTFSVGEERLSSRDGLLFGLAVIVFLLGSPPLLVGVRSRLHNISMNGVSRTLISSFAALILILSLANISTGWTGTYRGMSSALFQDSAVIVLLIGLLGHTLERHTRGKCCRINRVLYKLVPEKATVWRDGEETRIPLHELRERECGLYMCKGESVPAYGVLSSGKAIVDESPVSGLPATRMRDQVESMLAALRSPSRLGRSWLWEGRRR